MNITLNIIAGTPGELQEAIAGLAGFASGTVVSQSEKSEKQSRTTVQKSEKRPSPDPVESGKEESQETPNSETGDTPNTETETEEIPTVVELRAAAQEKGKTPEGKKAIKALLNEFESKSISDVPEEKRAAFLHKLENLGKPDTPEAE